MLERFVKNYLCRNKLFMQDVQKSRMDLVTSIDRNSSRSLENLWVQTYAKNVLYPFV